MAPKCRACLSDGSDFSDARSARAAALGSVSVDTGTCSSELFGTRGLSLERADSWCESNCRESPDWLMNADPLTHEEVVVHLVGDRVEIDGASACVLNAFHHTVAGVTSAFYAVDYRDGVTSYEVVRGQYMTLLEHASPWCNDDELLCKALCKEEGFCCNDPNVGSNQLLSCAQACMIRARGTGEDECKDACSAQTASRGCSREVNGHSYSMCSRCDDLDDTCPHGVQEHEHACHAGCAVAKEREICDFQPKDTCGNPGELCFYDPSCSNDASAVYFGGLGCNAGGVARNCRFCGFTTDSGVSYPNCPVMENALCRPTAHYNRSDIYTDAERERTALICSSYWSIDTCGQFREDLPCTEDLECTPESCPSGAAINGRCRNSGVANGIGSGKCRWVGPEPVHCERAECTEGVWQTEASNGYGTCGAQIEWVQDNVEGMGERTDACTLVAQQGESPECAPCGPPSPLSLPPPPPVSCWSEERAGSTPEHTIADKNSDSLEHCKHLCRADEKCKSVTFSAEAHSCRLIDRRALPVPMGDDAIVTNFNFELCFTAPVSGRAWGNRLGSKRRAATIEACQKLCRTHPSCKSFIYRATEMRQGAAGTCHLMSTFYEDRYRSDFRWPSEVPSVVSNFLFSDFCQHGIVSVGSFDSVAATSSGRNFQVCCDAACGTCGGQGCSQRTGGEAGCCTRAIASSDVECTEIDQTRCIIPNIDNGEEACEGHGYTKDQCQRIGCCQFAECPSRDGTGECHSNVGSDQCTSMPFRLHVEDDLPSCRIKAAEKEGTFRFQAGSPLMATRVADITTARAYTESKLCLVPAGDTPTSRRLFDSLAAGCLPVIMAPPDDILPNLPFPSVIDWQNLVLFGGGLSCSLEEHPDMTRTWFEELLSDSNSKQLRCLAKRGQQVFREHLSYRQEGVVSALLYELQHDERYRLMLNPSDRAASQTVDGV